MASNLQIVELENVGDTRGFSFTMPPEALTFVGSLGDVHMVAAKPGAVRGNHLHLRRREALVVLPGTMWSLHWSAGEMLAVERREFDGSRAVLVLIAAGTAHAVRCEGDGELWLVVISSGAYDPAETVRRQLI